MALLCFDHDLFRRGTADAAPLHALLDGDLDTVWRDELRARCLCLDGLVRGPGAVVDALESRARGGAGPAHQPPRRHG